MLQKEGAPKDQPKYEIQKLGVLGAGMMGAGIAYVSAKAGMDVVLKDVTVEGAEKGKAYSTTLLDKAIAKNVLPQKRKKRCWRRLHQRMILMQSKEVI